MKKFITLITVASAFALASCGNGSTVETTTATDSLKKDSVPAITVAVDTTAKTDTVSVKK